MEVVALLLLLVGVWLFIRHDQRKMLKVDKPLARQEVERGYVPGRDTKWMGLLGLCLLSLLGLAVELLNPSQPPFQGRWGWLWSTLYVTGGSLGITAYWSIAASVSGVAAALVYRARQQSSM